jgi:tetratricopeptide (TPR) repeat protein
VIHTRDVVVLLSCLVLGCSGGRETTTETPKQTAAATTPSSQGRDVAMQHFINGSLFEAKEEYAQAIIEFQDALRWDKDPAIYYALAKNYSALSKHSLAIESAREAVQRAPSNLEYRRLLANSYLQTFEVDSAALMYEELVKHDSAAIDSWFRLAQIYQMRDPKKALDTYNRIVQRFGPQWCCCRSLSFIT